MVAAQNALTNGYLKRVHSAAAADVKRILRSASDLLGSTRPEWARGLTGFTSLAIPTIQLERSRAGAWAFPTCL